jgi:hypothetical protein
MQRRMHAVVLLAYTAATITFSWPLPQHLGTHLTGGPGGDTGVYVWNQWVFRRELVEQRRFPYFTDVLFGPDQRTDLSLHNYTTFQDLLAVPLRTLFTVVETFNIVYLLMIVLTAYATFLLARHVTQAVPESWIAGLLFAYSPILVARGAGHFSLVAAAPLAVFLLLLLRASGRERMRDGIALGVTLAWAAMADVYYAIYCLVIGAMFVIGRVVEVEPRDSSARRRTLTRTLNAITLCLTAVVGGIAVSGGWAITIGGRVVGMRSLYTPVLVLAVLVLLQLARRFRFSFVRLTATDVRRFVGVTAVTGCVAAVLVSPVLYAAAVRVAHGEFDTPKIFWRSSPPGIDLLALVLPNPNHPLTPDRIAQWLTKRPNAFIENVASLPYVALLVLFLAWRAGWRPPRLWAGLCVTFGLLALGPFIHVAGVNSYVPGPWALLRYVPLVGLAHTPARFAIVLTLCFAVVVADALRELSRRRPDRRRLLLTVAGLLLAAELLPVPVRLYSAEIPPLYRHVAAAPPSTTLLELPYGVRDGVSNIGDFSARTEFNQTAHGRTVIGGYLSRVPRRRVDELLVDPVTRSLAILSEKRPLTANEQAVLSREGPRFVREKRIGFVVIDRARASMTFERLAIEALRLRHVETNGTFSLYATDPP